jgi:FkbM family methyltransferase
MSIKSLISKLFNSDSHAQVEESNDKMEQPQSVDKHSNSEQKLDRELVIVDIGCRWGFAEKFTQNRGDFRIYGFDPDIEECQRLNRRYEGEPVSIVPVGLAGHPGKRKLYITQEPACSSLLEPDANLTNNYPALHCARHVSSIEVETTTLDDWASNNGVQAIDHIKVDTQGTELEILKGGINVLKTVRSIEVEVEFNPIYLGQPIFSEVDMFLRNEGFVLWKLTNQVHYSRDGSTDEPIGEDIVCYDEKHLVRHDIFGGQLYWANAHYVRKSILEVDKNSDAQNLRDFVLFQTLSMSDVVSHLGNKGSTR